MQPPIEQRITAQASGRCTDFTFLLADAPRSTSAQTNSVYDHPHLERTLNDLARFEALVPLDHGLSVVVTRRVDQTPHTTVVNAGVLPHPVTGDSAVAFVAARGTRKLAHLRADPTIAVVVRAGWQWTSVEGQADLIGPDDPHPDVDDERLRLLLREIFSAAGGTHDDWTTYDRVMREERRTAVFVAPRRVYSNP